MKNGIESELESLVDWDSVMQQPRYAGGHEEVMRSIFGPTAEVVAWYSDNDYQGSVAIAHRLADGRITVMTDYYGSCSGCDAWEDSSDEDARKMILDLTHSARVFDTLEEAQNWCRNINAKECPQHYPFEVATNLWP